MKLDCNARLYHSGRPACAIPADPLIQFTLRKTGAKLTKYSHQGSVGKRKTGKVHILPNSLRLRIKLKCN
ncbi:MAG: hypothetical protein BGN92_12460 [Sphingobacteriales bacterium 41-5]|nr:MAG: hypothetical protein BGN92_12460 [Sphingobacteriales bacterium 41-5]